MRLIAYGCGAIVATMTAVLLPNIVQEVYGQDGFSLGDLASIGTLYALYIAIFEVWRTGSSAEKVASANELAVGKVNLLTGQRDLVSCQEAIQNCLQQIDDEKPISSAIINRIVYLYSGYFCDDSDGQDVEDHCTVLQGYVASGATPSMRDTQPIRKTFMLMTRRIAKEIKSSATEVAK